jgi:pimeloyl-ACP methyl ester carboxylesterase
VISAPGVETFSGQLRARDGTRLAYRRYGPSVRGEARTTPVRRIALCDGISCDGYIWRDLLPVLARDSDILHLNYRGHGRSGIPRDPTAVTVPHLVNDLAFALRRLEWTDTILIGHSMGVQIALETALRHPDLVSHLVLCCGSHGRLLDTFRHTDLGAKLLPIIDAVTVTFRDAVAAAVRALMPSSLSYALAALTEIKAERMRPADLQPYLDHFARMPLDLFTGLLTDAAERTALPSLPRILQPTLVIAAEDDGFTPLAVSRLMAEALPNAELVVVPDASHTAPLEAPVPFENAILGFFEQLEDPVFRTRSTGIRPLGLVSNRSPSS